MRKVSHVAVAAILLALVGVTGAPAEPARKVARGTDVIRLAELGNARAQTRLGFMFATGRGVPQNYTEAAYWYGRAAEQGDPNAQYLLGVCFNYAKGVPLDWVLAHKWLNLSASRTRPGDEREHRVRMRDAIASKLTSVALRHAQKLALAWRPKPER
jgi:TPR repeat protein